MNSANIVSASSEYEKELIINSYGVDNLKIKYISPGVNQELFSIDNEIKRENIFLSIGRVQSQKGQMETIKFLNSFRKVEKILNVISLVVQVDLLAMNIIKNLQI